MSCFFVVSFTQLSQASGSRGLQVVFVDFALPCIHHGMHAVAPQDIEDVQ